MVTFNHSGKIGDLLFSLYFCKESSQLFNESQFNFHIQTNVYERDGVTPGFNKKIVNFILPLLKQQKYINEITYSNIVPSDAFDLVDVRKLPLNIMSSDIRSWYYNLVIEHLPREFWKPIIFVEPNYKFKDKIILTWTPRYQNYFTNFKYLEKYKDILIFFGVLPEYEMFKKNYFTIPYFKVNNLLEAAQYIAGAKGIIGVPGGLFSLAECMKIPRILVSSQWFLNQDSQNFIEGPLNVHPIGGWNEVAATNEKMIISLQRMIEI